MCMWHWIAVCADQKYDDIGSRVMIAMTSDGSMPKVEHEQKYKCKHMQTGEHHADDTI